MLNRYLFLIKRHMHEQYLTIFMWILLKNTWGDISGGHGDLVQCMPTTFFFCTNVNPD